MKENKNKKNFEFTHPNLLIKRKIADVNFASTFKNSRRVPLVASVVENFDGSFVFVGPTVEFIVCIVVQHYVG